VIGAIYFFTNPLQGSPLELNTAIEGICADLIPNKVQPFGNLGSQVEKK
jgi:hypothetical protein